MKASKALIPVLLFSAVLSAVAAQPNRITSSIDNHNTVVLKANVRTEAKAQFDRGPVDPSMKLEYVTLMLQATAAQKADLQQLLAQQQDPTSSNYHKWLQPEDYAVRFGLSQGDIGKITAWLQGQGFAIVTTARGQNWVAFSGTAAQIQATFHTQIHHYEVNGELHYANATAPSIPRALQGIVAAIHGLDDFRPKSMALRKQSYSAIGGINPLYYTGGAPALAPGDIATIYNVGALYTAGYDGTGEKIAIVGETDINLTDINAFRSMFGLPSNPPQVVLYGTDPGTVSGVLPEADLDLEWSGAVAPQATIIYVNSTNVFTSAQNAIDNNLAPVISMSFGGCESSDQAYAQAVFDPLLAQANAQGITFLAASGDNGAAGCDYGGTIAQNGLAVIYPGSSPSVTAVGGTEFNEGGGSYWGSTNGSSGGSALSYIPEMGWDDTSGGTGLDTRLAASGGGKSAFETKPSWQTGPGVPSDGMRDVPDIAFSASADHDAYVVCTGGSCSVAGQFSEYGGTSVATPVFAGMVALLNQYQVKNGFQTTPGLGLINPTLYQYAPNVPSAFHDITVGSNIVPCQQGTLNCPATAPFEFGYKAGPGYDQVTGVGSVDAYNFVTGWNSGAKIPTSVSLQPSASQVGAGASLTLTATVTHATGTGTPTGNVTFYHGSTQLGTGTLDNTGKATYTTSSLPKGVDSLTATYAGDSTFASSTSSATKVTVGLTSTAALTVSSAQVQMGSAVSLTATVSSSSGTPTGTVTFYNGSAQLGTGTLSAGVATYKTSSLALGSYTITASYGGDSNYIASTSAAVALSVQDFQFTAGATSVTVTAPGQTGQATFTVTPESGFNQALTFSCSGLPSAATCSFAPATVTPAGSAVTTTLTVQTTAASAKLDRQPFNRGVGSLYALVLPGLLGIVFVPTSRKRTLSALRLLSLIAVLALFALSMAACGGGNSPPAGNPGTPAGSSTVTITAANAASTFTHTMQVTLQVQ